MTSLAAAVDLTEYSFWQPCDLGCEREAVFIAKGCMDKEPVCLCGPCLKRGLEVVRNFIRIHQRTQHRIVVCGDCYRPILNLETHLDIQAIPAQRDRQRPERPAAMPIP